MNAKRAGLCQLRNLLVTTPEPLRAQLRPLTRAGCCDGDRSGDRRLNRALHMILVTRRRAHAPMIAYIERCIQEGKSRREATRCLKRYRARSLYRLLEHGPPIAT